MSLGAIRYGISRSVGRSAQPLSAAAAPTPASLRKSRRLKTTGSLMREPRLVMACESVHDGGILAVGGVLLLPVTADAPPHLERRILVHHRHLLDRAVALLAADPAQHVALVVELDVLRQVVDRHPGNRLAAVSVLGQLLDLGPV